MKIIIIGTGNVATVLGGLLKRAGHEIGQVYGRNADAAKSLALKLDSDYCNEWKDLMKDADLYIAAISDKAIMEMADILKLDSGIMVHTAGAVRAGVLNKVSKDYGVLYPLQSIRKELAPAANLPLLVNGSNEATKGKLLKVATSISATVVVMTDEEREKLHVAAVVVNNFSNHLYALAEAYCLKEQLNFKLLLPLIRETGERLEYVSPQAVTTGPAIRKDQVTINRHMELLTAHPALKDIYELLTTSIRKHG